jgi:hypothetical protein
VTAPALAARRPVRETHDWMVVAPWWHWSPAGDIRAGRLTAPVIQKYATDRFTEVFLRDPQRRLEWTDDDLVQLPTRLTPVIGGDGKTRRLSDLVLRPDPRRIRKLFLASHQRFYLVVCQVHCDTAGFPRVDAAKPAQVGFVVRRRTTSIPAAGVASGATILQQIVTERSALQYLSREAALGAFSLSAPMAAPVLQQARTTAAYRGRASVQARLGLARRRLEEWATQFGIATETQAWVRTPGQESVGRWVADAGAAGTVADETVYPMWPVPIVEGDRTHAARYGTVFFGVVPTSSDETEADGRARFDDQTLYEIHCFVRRRCPVQVFVGAPTARYRLAAHFDPIGCGQRAVTVQLPDLDQLAASPRTLGVAFAKPTGTLMVQGNKDGITWTGRSRFPEICFFPIPLITIIAMFVFQLFLPIVVLVFQLWWMLALKFCIPPELGLAAGVTAELDVELEPPQVDLDIRAAVHLALERSFRDPVTNVSTNPDLVSGLKNGVSAVAIANLQAGDQRAAQGRGPTVTSGIVWAPRVEHP